MLAAAVPARADVGPREAREAAAGDPNVLEAQRGDDELEPSVSRQDDGNWRVSWITDDDEVVRVVVDPASGAVRESWTGYQVAWQMARGNEGQFGHVLNAPYVWIPLCAVFLFGLFDWRRPLRIAHLDLLVLLAFGVSHVFFNRGEIGLSVPLAYPPLIYLFARMVWVGLRGGERLRPTAPALALGIVAAFLIAFRVTLNIADSGVIDVGYAGVIGADRAVAGEPLYGEGAFPDDNPSGDTYGPVNYYAYVPFELALPWSGEWDDLPAAHAAAIAFDLATVVGLVLLGMRLRPGAPGRRLGIVLAFAWVAFPYTAFALQSSANDSLVAALVVWSLVAFASPAGRGILLALAAATKFAPLALAPLYAAGERRLLGRPRSRSLRGASVFTAALLGTLAVVLIQPTLDPGPATFWERTVVNQADRESPFSVWGQEPSLARLRTVAIAIAGAAAILVAFVPRRRSLPQIVALAAAILIAVQVTAEHWFYLYIPWFLGPLLAVILAGVRVSRSNSGRLRRSSVGAG